MDADDRCSVDIDSLRPSILWASQKWQAEGYTLTQLKGLMVQIKEDE